MEFKSGENDKGRRLDRVLRKAMPGHPLPFLYRLLRQGLVLVDGKPAKAQYRLNCGETITIPLESGQKPEPRPPSPTSLANPVKIGFNKHQAVLEIIWQDRGLIAVNKPAGLEVHGPESLETIVSAFLADKLPPSLSFKPGPLHRLDKPSSGIVVFSTNIEGARLFSSLLRERKARKTYMALVEGSIEKEETWQDELVRDFEKKKTFAFKSPSAGSKTALTVVRPFATNGKYSLITAEIRTGRTHQIRAQAAARGHPLAGDRKYGSREQGGFFLHAWKLEFLEYSIEAPPPAAFNKKITEIFLPRTTLTKVFFSVSERNVTDYFFERPWR
jgi:23S rRNA pseudouridine955/2504/2580 synthase